jgi:hypothetical protein
MIGTAQCFDPGGFSSGLIGIMVFLLFIVYKFLSSQKKVHLKCDNQAGLYFTSYTIPSLMSAPYSNEGVVLQTVSRKDDGSNVLPSNPYYNHDRQTVYLSNNHGMPIVFDTGASSSVSPLREDFIGELQPPQIQTLQGLKGTISVAGSGTVEWTIFDVYGITRTIKTKALYIPEGNIRLFSPQVYFQENSKGSAIVSSKFTSLQLADETICWWV